VYFSLLGLLIVWLKINYILASFNLLEKDTMSVICSCFFVVVFPATDPGKLYRVSLIKL